MNIKDGAKRTKPLIDFSILPNDNPEYGRMHLHNMCRKIIKEEITGEKAHRWLGYVQGCICSSGGATLKELKGINRM